MQHKWTFISGSDETAENIKLKTMPSPTKAERMRIRRAEAKQKLEQLSPDAKDAVRSDKGNLKDVGKKVILHSSFTG